MPTEQYIKWARTLSSHNSHLLNDGRKCVCYYCKRVYSSSEIEEFFTKSSLKGDTAICPHCDIDSVIPDGCGLDIYDSDLIDILHDRAFASDIGYSSSLMDVLEIVKKLCMSDIDKVELAKLNIESIVGDDLFPVVQMLNDFLSNNQITPFMVNRHCDLGEKYATLTEYELVLMAYNLLGDTSYHEMDGPIKALRPIITKLWDEIMPIDRLRVS